MPVDNNDNPECVDISWSSGWKNQFKTCGDGYYLTGMYKTSGSMAVNYITGFRCCKPAGYNLNMNSTLHVGSVFEGVGYTHCGDAPHIKVMGGFELGNNGCLSKIDAFNCRGTFIEEYE